MSNHSSDLLRTLISQVFSKLLDCILHGSFYFNEDDTRTMRGFYLNNLAYICLKLLNLHFLMQFWFFFCSRPNLLHHLQWDLRRHLRSNLPCDCSEESSEKMFQRHGNGLRTQRGNYLRAHRRGKIPKTKLSILHIIFRKLRNFSASLLRVIGWW